MLLLLSSKKPANSSYVTETGQILYKVNRRKPTTGPVIIRKAVGTVQGVWHGDSGTHELPDRRVSRENSTAPEVEGQLLDETENDPSSSIEGPKFEGHFAFSAQIGFNAFANSRFQYNSLDVPVQTYLRREAAAIQDDGTDKSTSGYSKMLALNPKGWSLASLENVPLSSKNRTEACSEIHFVRPGVFSASSHDGDSRGGDDDNSKSKNADLFSIRRAANIHSTKLNNHLSLGKHDINALSPIFEHEHIQWKQLGAFWPSQKADGLSTSVVAIIMLNITGIAPDCIPANPDIAGIGIRVAVYLQSFIGIAISLWAMRDNKLTKGEARVIWTHASGVLLTSCSLFLSAIIQAKTYGMSTYHGLIILNLGWINNASDFLRHFVTVHRRVTGRKAEGTVFGFKTNSPLVAFWASSFHTLLLAIFGLWFWTTVDTFGDGGQCDPHLPIPLYILGHRVPITDHRARKAFLVVYSILLAPFARSLITLPFIAGPGIIILLMLRPCIKRRTDKFSEEFLSNALLVCSMITIAAINVAIVVGTETMIREVAPIVGEGESQWTFGQTVAMFLLVPPIIELLHVWKNKDNEVDSLVGSDSGSA
ncbi:hypothetical protein D9756_008801 [Leucocoprinus leucothites]|uniref:Uncharacterized protein n=1 Tax=Leucocoprinus leucothites TaxID=201217 RepID=A0A8H5CYS9_9AGAR|nr:hypothetical protein D9756_008801 [Leucoagaricus leucothites]